MRDGPAPNGGPTPSERDPDTLLDLMALADSSGAACAFLDLPDGSQGTTTVESKTNFVRGVREGYVEAVSHPLHVGRTVVVVETDARDNDDHLVARVTQTQLVLR